MNESDLNIGSEEADSSKKVAANSKVSMLMGISAILPYVCLILYHWLWDIFIADLPYYGSFFDQRLQRMQILSILGGPGFVLGFIVGIPLGLAAIITGKLSLARKPKMERYVRYAYLGIVFGVGACIGHVWYFATCQICQ
jgi:hypothetical protein